MRKELPNANTVAGTIRPRRRPAWLRGAPSALLLLVLACSGSGPTTLVGTPGDEDPTTQPPDSTPLPPDSTPVPPDTTPVPPDTTTPPPAPPPVPPDSTVPDPPSGPVSHVGLAFGPARMPSDQLAEFSATSYTASDPDTLIRVLDAARQANAQLFISFTGNQANFQDDSGGIDMAKWKARVDRFRGLDLTPYIADETIAGHLLLDEPWDKSNWNGKPVSQPQIEELARYSKEVWPAMVTVLRTHYDFLAGSRYPHLDAVRIQYHSRFGSLDDYINTSVAIAKSLGQAVIGGVNLLDGGTEASGIPGKREGKFAMSAEQIRSWGRRFLTDPNICGFIMYQYDSTYLARPDIRAAMADLSELARTIPKKSCRL
jgi:hypothetical protein